MSEIITFSGTLTTVVCPKCAGHYAISKAYKDEAFKLGHFKQCWTCPYCKEERGYGEGEIDKLQKEIAQKEKVIAYERERKEYAQRESRHFRASRDAVKGVLTKHKKRVGNGVCPCCNRTFQNLMAHMATKHPDHATVES